MTSLHALFALRDQHAFQRLLEGSSKGTAPAGGTASSGGRSWNKPSALALALSLDVNARDRLGRSVLHLACAATDSAAVEYVRMLLAHPGVHVNLLDTESHWTALHRALYHGNLAAAILLLQRSDTDASLTDLEGYTAFDLYNTTIENTKPEMSDPRTHMELFTWGANRNAALGHADDDDRAHPEQVQLRRSDRAGGDAAFRQTLAFRLKPAAVRDVHMSRLHTVVVTDEPRGNVRTCGFASTGRLGPGGGQHTQHLLAPLPLFEAKIVAIALGQDHTLALTDTGTVLSWGLNRFSQLGYDVPSGARGEEPVQATPRGVTGLKKEIVVGVAACKTASACWTERAVFTWGRNNGQLGYDKTAHPVQPVPRLVSRITRPVISIALTDNGMACLLSTNDVILLFGDGHVRINFPSEVNTMPSDFLAYRPPHAINNASIAKIVCSDSLFAAVSSNGEIFTFGVPTEAEMSLAKEKGPIIRPQRVWALRKQWSAVKDAALGSDGTIIICTESGHVFVRSRNLKSGQGAGAKTFKFQRVPYIQRAVGVRANDTGAMSALRLAFRPDPVDVTANDMAQDLAKIRPYVAYNRALGVGEVAQRIEPGQIAVNVPSSKPPRVLSGEEDDEDDREDVGINSDVAEITRLWEIVRQDRLARKQHDGRGLYDYDGAAPLAYGADLAIRVQANNEFPVHGLILGARCAVFADLLSGKKGIHDRDSGISVKYISPAPHDGGGMRDLPRLSFTGCHVLSVLILVHYLYTDTLLAIVDNRVSRQVQALLGTVKLQPTQVVRELQALVRVLDLPRLSDPLRLSSKCNPEPSMASDMGRLFNESQLGQDQGARFHRPDIVLQLADRSVFCHSAVLRARTPFFEAFFDEEDWTVQRWKDGGISIDLSHLSWREMEYVLRFMCCGEEGEMFDRLDFIDSVDQLLDFLLDVMSAANELLLDRLLLICSSIVLKYVNIHNVCSVLADAFLLHCVPFTESLQRYMAVNMETLLESRMLDDLSPRLITHLSQSIRQYQAAKLPVSRSNHLVDAALARNREWLELQDIAVPIIRSAPSKASPRLSPKRNRRTSLPVSPIGSPSIRPHMSRVGPSTPAGDDIFTMDEADFVPALNLDTDAQDPAGAKPGPWRAKSTNPKVDLKAILAEEESQSSIVGTPSRDRLRPSFPLPMTGLEQSPSPSALRAGSGTPWRIQGPPASPSPIHAPLLRASPCETPVQTPPPVNRAAEPARPAQAVTTPVWSGQPATTQGTTRSPQVLPGLGPVITPSRQLSAISGPSVARRVPSGGIKAWTAPPSQPTVQPAASSSALSFAEIQQLQIQQDAVPAKDRRSLKEIQAEEQERQAEADFMRWWAAEEERLRLETDAQVAAAQKASRPKKPSKRTATKKPAPVPINFGAEATVTKTDPSPRAQRKYSKRAAPSPAKNTPNL